MSISSNNLLRTGILFLAAITLAGCAEIEPDTSIRKKIEDYNVKEFLYNVYMTENLEIENEYSLMTGWYYWKDQVPQRSTELQESIEQFFNEILSPEDKWSWMQDKESYIASESGIISGTFGGSFSQPIDYFGDYSIILRYVFPDSPLGKAGAKRGWTLLKINGVEWRKMDLSDVNKIILHPELDVKYQFEFKDEVGDIHVLDLMAAKSIATNPILEKKVFTADDFPGLTEKVGYLLYLGFKANFLNDLKNAIAELKAQGITKLILDLRYNPGGDGTVSSTLANLIAAPEADGKVLVKRVHNNHLKSMDKETVIKRNESSLDLSELYIIAGPGSASASEMILNGLKPLMNVKHIGGRTYGKPNGMYLLFYPGTNDFQIEYILGDYSRMQYVFYPICYFNSNSRNEQIPMTGLVPDNNRPDDIYHDFSAEEDNIKACLTYMVTGNFPELPTVKAVKSPALQCLGLEEETRIQSYGEYSIKF